jgi:foldase protein PrsA
VAVTPRRNQLTARRIMTARLRWLAVFVVAGLALAACSDAPDSAAAPAATVAGATITDAELAHQASLYTFLSALSQQPCGGPAPQGQTQEAVCNRFALTNAIQALLVRTYAEDHDITVTDQQVTDIIANLDGQIGADTVDTTLKAQGLTRDDLRELARSVLLFQDVQRRVVGEQLGDEQLRQLYEDNILDYTTVQAEHILVDTEQEAQDVYRQVTAPGATEATFHDLAKKVSTDTGSAKNGGSLGSAVASSYLPEFAQAVAALKPGEISQPVQTQVGWHVIRLVTKQVTPFAQAKTQLVQDQSPTLFNDWVRGQVEDGDLQVNPKYGRFDEQSLSVVAIQSTDPSASPSGASATVAPATASPTP